MTTATYICAGLGIVLLLPFVGCSSTSQNDEPVSAGGASTGGISSGGASGSSTLGGSGGSAGVESDASSGGTAGAIADGGTDSDAGKCSGTLLVEYDFTVCATSCLSAGLCGTAPSCGVTYVCQFDSFNTGAPSEYFLPFEGACSGKLVLTSVGSQPAKIEFYGKGPNDAGDVLLDTIVSQFCATPGTKSFSLTAPISKAVLTVPDQTTAYIDNVQLND